VTDRVSYPYKSTSNIIVLYGTLRTLVTKINVMPFGDLSDCQILEIHSAQSNCTNIVPMQKAHSEKQQVTEQRRFLVTTGSTTAVYKFWFILGVWQPAWQQHTAY